MRRASVAVAVAVTATYAVAASPASAVRFAVIGDWGAGTKAQRQVAERMCAVHAVSRIGFILTTGDNFYPQGTATPATFGRPSRCLIRARIPWRAVWGNHDLGGSSTATVLKAPARWYTFVSGAVRIVVLDGNQPEHPGQLRFLERTLRQERVRPVIVASHQPTRTAGLHEPRTVQQRLWEPLFIRYRVRLVLQGHNHMYERIRYRGVTYITSGGGGAPLYPCARPAAGLLTCKSVHNFLMVEVTPTRIGVRALDRTGRVIDRAAWKLTPPSG